MHLAILLVEGGSDTAALVTMNLAVVGRPIKTSSAWIIG